MAKCLSFKVLVISPRISLSLIVLDQEQFKFQLVCYFLVSMLFGKLCGSLSYPGPFFDALWKMLQMCEVLVNS